MDYSIFYKTRYAPTDDWRTPLTCDVFVSAFNKSERVVRVFNNVAARRKLWLAHPEYSLPTEELPDECFRSDSLDEAEFVRAFLEWAQIDFSSERVLIDSTGFMRPQLVFLLRYLAESSVRKVEVTYAEPGQYAARENTQFAAGTVMGVRQIRGFSGNHSTESDSDLLIIGAGYEHDLIGYVADNRKTARRVQLMAFPPLQPDFFQEAVLRGARVREAVGKHDVYFAPANDPFSTAEMLQEIVTKEHSRRGIGNLYLSPLATKAQALGFAYYYILELIPKSASIIFPFSDRYHAETSRGFTGLWHYVFEFPASVPVVAPTSISP